MDNIQIPWTPLFNGLLYIEEPTCDDLWGDVGFLLLQTCRGELIRSTELEDMIFDQLEEFCNGR